MHACMYQVWPAAQYLFGVKVSPINAGKIWNVEGHMAVGSKIKTYNESGFNEKYEVLFNSETCYKDY